MAGTQTDGLRLVRLPVRCVPVLQLKDLMRREVVVEEPGKARGRPVDHVGRHVRHPRIDWIEVRLSE